MDLVQEETRIWNPLGTIQQWILIEKITEQFWKNQQTKSLSGTQQIGLSLIKYKTLEGRA